MKMTNEQMGNYYDLLSNLHETGKLGFAIAKNKNHIESVAKEYINLRSELFQKYGKISADGKTATVSKENVPKYKEEMGDIPEEEEDVDVYQIDEEIFCSGHLTSDQMSMLMWMVKGE